MYRDILIGIVLLDWFIPLGKMSGTQKLQGTIFDGIVTRFLLSSCKQIYKKKRNENCKDGVHIVRNIKFVQKRTIVQLCLNLQTGGTSHGP